MFYAHTKEDGQWQALSDHLVNVSKLAGRFALPKLKRSAEFLGLLHDLGKYQPSFQRRLKGDNVRVDHSVCGAIEARKLIGDNPAGNLFAYAVAGHHAGLPDIGNKMPKTELRARLDKDCENFSAYEKELGGLSDVTGVMGELKKLLTLPESQSAQDIKSLADRYEFTVRYLYSCLVDADFLDTENFCQGRKREEPVADWELCRRQLEEKLSGFAAVTSLQKSRAGLQLQASRSIEASAPISLLNMPTGSGKTLCSVKLALELLWKNKLKRIIYVIPYTSIIEQTAKEFGEIFSQLYILQHHSAFDFDENVAENLGEHIYAEGINAEMICRRRTENWDAPFIITTNVQFFESIYSNRSGKLRKLHNMAESVIVFDEIHTLPIKYFIPCMKAIAQLTTGYNSRALLLTATMPDYAKMYREYTGEDLPATDLIADKSEYGNFEKCTFEYLGECDLLTRLDGKKNTLIVFNTKKAAKRYYDDYVGKKYHLSTFMTPLSRTRVIDEIRKDLKSGKEKIVVFTTSLIEAGVDLDFECVYRELAGVDNILQAAGRCNREGRSDKSNSFVYIFTAFAPRGEMAIKAQITKGLIGEFGIGAIGSEKCVAEYYRRLYGEREWLMMGTQPANVQDEKALFDINFRDIAEKFKLIETSTVGVVIPCEENQKEVDALKLGFADKRKLQKYCATVSFYQLKQLIGSGLVCEYSGVFVLTDPKSYSPQTGIKVDCQGDYFYE